MPRSLQLRRRPPDTLPRVRGRADAVPDVVSPDDWIRHVVVRKREVLLRLRVVGRLVRDSADLADLALDFLDDLLVVDDGVLELRVGRQVEEDVVPALRGCFGL